MYKMDQIRMCCGAFGALGLGDVLSDSPDLSEVTLIPSLVTYLKALTSIVGHCLMGECCPLGIGNFVILSSLSLCPYLTYWNFLGVGS